VLIVSIDVEVQGVRVWGQTRAPKPSGRVTHEIIISANVVCAWFSLTCYEVSHGCIRHGEIW